MKFWKFELFLCIYTKQLLVNCNIKFLAIRSSKCVRYILIDTRIITLSWLIITLTLSRRRTLSYRNQFIDLLCKSMDWFLPDRDHPHERAKAIRYSFVCYVPWRIQNTVRHLNGAFCENSQRLKAAISSEYASDVAKYFKNLYLTTSALVTSPFESRKTAMESVYFLKIYNPTDCSLIAIKQICWLFSYL